VLPARGGVPDTVRPHHLVVLVLEGVAVGFTWYSRQQRLLYVVHAEVTPEAIRIISARKATKHEKTRYEND